MTVPRIVPRLVPLAATSLLVFGCSDAEPSGSFPEVRNPVPAQTASAPVAFRVGESDGTGPEVFGRVGFVGVDRAGQVHVMDWLVQEVRVFDGDGGHLQTYGRPGEGPGEMLGATGVGFPPDGSLHVWDPRQRRFSIFDSDFAFLRSEPAPAIPLSGGAWRGKFAADGSLLIPGAGFVGLDPSRQETQNFQQVIQLVRFGAELTSADTVASFSLPRTAFAGNFIVPFETTGTHDFDDEETVWFAPSAEYRILERAPSGDTVVAFGVAMDPVGVTPAELDSVSEAMPAVPGRPALDRSLVPEMKPMVRLVVNLGDGWVGVFPEMGAGTGSFLDVFRPGGELAARVELAAPLQLSPRPWMHGTRLYGVTLGELDLPFVVGLDLSGVVGGSLQHPL